MRVPVPLLFSWQVIEDLFDHDVSVSISMVKAFVSGLCSTTMQHVDSYSMPISRAFGASLQEESSGQICRLSEGFSSKIGVVRIVDDTLMKVRRDMRTEVVRFDLPRRIASVGMQATKMLVDSERHTDESKSAFECQSHIEVRSS